MKIICNHCGAEIDDLMPKCPYCETMLPKGAEAEYMEKLYNIQEDMEELNEIPMEVVRKEVKHQGRRIRKIAGITIILFVILGIILFYNEKKYERNHTEDYIWGQENFPVMSEMYENGEYEALLEFYMNASEDDRPVWDWEYYDAFMEWMEDKE